MPDSYDELDDGKAFDDDGGAGVCWDDPEARPSGLDPLNGFPELNAPDLSPAATETWPHRRQLCLRLGGLRVLPRREVQPLRH